MNLSILLSMLAAGLFSSNIIASSGLGVDFATNNLSSIKNALYYSLVILCTALLSSITIFLINLMLTAMDVEKFLIVAALLIVSVYVQIAEYLLKKIMPLFFTQTKYFVPSLVSTLFIMVICAFASASSFLELFVTIICESLGILLVLTIIAGIRQTNRVQNKPELLKGNLISLVILLFIMMAWTAF